MSVTASLPKLLRPGDFEAKAKVLALPVVLLLTCDELETGGLGGFLPSGLSRGLFEALPFHRDTGGRYDRSHPDLSSPVWNRALYKGGEAERRRLDAARELDERAAVRSYSWGRYQLMGFNHVACGWEDPHEFAFDMDTSELHHLDGWGNFLRANKLDVALRTGDYPRYFRVFNGAGYEKNGYGTKFLSILKRRSGQADDTLIGKLDMLRIGMRGDRVKALQDRLRRAGVYLGESDGIFGPGTQAAVAAFQASRGLGADGVAGPLTLGALP